uniref:EOG090X06BA n=1 Tax=Lynceus sp. MCZ IZ 141354 TaxID=1930659 RepID=A0A9N6WR57_9CRUS|nr:EOG090X06BA [Lynceus sp. MCZ IZ 141354]
MLSTSRGGLTPLHMAAANGHTEVVQSILSKLPRNAVNVLSSDKATPLHLAVAFKRTQTITQLLLQPNINLEAKAAGGLTALHLAAGTDQAQVLLQMLVLGVSIDEKSDLGLTALHYAAWYGCKNAVPVLLRLADVNSKTQRALTPLHLAVVANQASIVEMLIAKANVQIDSPTENSVTPLHFTAATGRNTILIQLAKKGADINARDKIGKTPLDMATEAKLSSTSNTLIMLGGKSSTCLRIGNSNEKNNEGFTLLQIAAQKGNLKKVKELLSCGADVNAISNIGSNALHEAAYFGHHDIVAVLIEAGIDPKQKKTDGWAAIHLGCLASDPVPTLTVLLQKGVDVNMLTNDGKTALDISVQEGKSSAETFLRTKGAKGAICIPIQRDINAKDANGWTALHRAASEGNSQNVKELLKCGALTTIFSSIGSLPLHEAAWEGHEAAVRELLAGGADANMPKIDGSTPLHLAAATGRATVIKLLLEKGANPYIKNSIGSLPIHEAAYGGHRDAVREFLAAGVDPNAKKIDGATSLHLAAIAGHASVAKLLLEHRADPNIKSTDGQTALDYAVANNHKDVADIIKSYGGNQG